MELVGIVLWFNPVIMLYKRSLQTLHEYLADHRVLQQGIEQGAYLNLLLRQLTLQNEWIIGHHFNYLLTKNRFKMLKNHHYSKWALAKVVFVLPFIALLLMLNCKNKPEEPQTVEYEITFENTESASDEEVTYEIEITKGENKGQRITVKKESIPEDATIVWADDGNEYTYVKKDDDPPVRFAKEMPEPVGGFDAMYKFLQENLRYPAEAREKGISGQVFIEFVVEKDGTITNARVIKSSGNEELDAEALRVVNMMPKWKPGKEKGKPVRTIYQIPVRFTVN